MSFFLFQIVVLSLCLNNQLNYLGTLYTVKECTRLMIASGNAEGCKFVLCSSLAAYVGFVGWTAYTPTKYAIRGLAECLRQELILYGIDVHCLFPGTILTPGFIEEKKLKPALCSAMEGDDGMSPFDVAVGSLKGVKRGEFMVTCEMTGDLLRCGSRGLMPGNGVWWDAMWGLITKVH